MKLETVIDLVATMGGMKYFPSDPAVRLALCETIGDMTHDEDRVRWLVKRMRTLYPEWPGELEMRACYCSKFRPLDGMEVYSSVFSEGIPSEKPQEPFGLIEGGSNDPKLGQALKQLVAAKGFPCR